MEDKNQATSDEQSRKALQKAKRETKKARSKAREAQDAAKRAAKREDKRRKEAAFKQTIVDGYVLNEEGVPYRKYSKIEKLLDNKVIGYGIGFGFIFLCVGLFVFLYSINR